MSGGQLRYHHGPPLEHLPEPVPADSRVHVSPDACTFAARVQQHPSTRRTCPALPHGAGRQTGDTRAAQRVIVIQAGSRSSIPRSRRCVLAGSGYSPRMFSRSRRSVIGVVGHAVQVRLLALIGIEHHGLQAGFPRPEDVTVHVVADVQRVLGRHGHPVERELEQPPVGLAVSVVAGNDDRVEVAEQADPVQFAAGVRALRVGDERERVALCAGRRAPRGRAGTGRAGGARCRGTSRPGTAASAAAFRRAGRG